MTEKVDSGLRELALLPLGKEVILVQVLQY